MYPLRSRTLAKARRPTNDLQMPQDSISVHPRRWITTIIRPFPRAAAWVSSNSSRGIHVDAIPPLVPPTPRGILSVRTHKAAWASAVIILVGDDWLRDVQVLHAHALEVFTVRHAVTIFSADGVLQALTGRRCVAERASRTCPP